MRIDYDKERETFEIAYTGQYNKRFPGGERIEREKLCRRITGARDNWTSRDEDAYYFSETGIAWWGWITHAKLLANEPAVVSFQRPEIGDTWQHSSGRLYRVIDIANTASVRPEYPETVIYRNAVMSRGNTHTWSRPLSDWHRSMTFVSHKKPSNLPTKVGTAAAKKAAAKRREARAKK